MLLSRLQQEVKAWAQHNFPNAKPYQPLLGAVEEIGELAHAHLKEEQQIRGNTEEHQAAKVDAVADIIIYLADYCWRNNINLEEAVEKTWASVVIRDWVKYPTNGITH